MTLFKRILGGLGAAILMAPLAFGIELEKVGQIDDLVPAAFHQPPGAGQLEARRLDPVVRDETLTTTDKGGLRVTFADGSELTLGANSQAHIDEFVYPGPGQGNATIELVSGVFRFVSGQMDEAGVKVETPTASIGIRGTVIYVVVLPNGTTIQITDRGRAQIYSKQTGKSVITEEQSGASVDATGALSTPISFADGSKQSNFENPELMLGLVPADAPDGYPAEINMLPSGSTRTPPSNRQYNLAKPGDIVVNNETGKGGYLAAYFMWDQVNPGRAAADIVRARAIGTLTRRTGEVGSSAGRATAGLRPRNRANDIIVGVFTSTTALEQSDWTVTAASGASPIAVGTTFGSITAPGAGPITSLNNAGSPEDFQVTMVKTFKLGAGDRLFSISGFANFVTNEFPDYVGQGFNDDVQIILKTPGGQTIELSQLFNASVDGSVFTLVNGLPVPLSDQGGQTGWKSFFNRLRVAAGGEVTIEVRIANRGDGAVPSAVLLNNIAGSGSR